MYIDRYTDKRQEGTTPQKLTRVYACVMGLWVFPLSSLGLSGVPKFSSLFLE